MADHESNHIIEVNERSGEPSDTRRSKANSAYNRARSLNYERNSKKTLREISTPSLGQHNLSLNFYSQDIVTLNSDHTASFASENPEPAEIVQHFKTEKKLRKNKRKKKTKLFEIIPGMLIDSVSSSHDSPKSLRGCTRAPKQYSNYKFWSYN